MKKALENRQDIEKLVRLFYQNIRNNTEINYIFDIIPAQRWEYHLDKMFRFWSSILIEENSYHDNPMLKHIKLNEKIPLTFRHFDVWLEIWIKTVNSLFEGPLAEEAIIRAKTIKEMMAKRVLTDELPFFMSNP